MIHDFLQELCKKSNLPGIAYVGGPMVEEGLRKAGECTQSGVVRYVTYPDNSEERTCKHEDVDKLLNPKVQMWSNLWFSE